MQPKKAFGWAARDSSGVLSISLHFLRKTFTCSKTNLNTNGPLLPGQEIVGVVTEVGSKVEKFQVGEKVGVGCVLGSCHTCDNCANNLENYCNKMILTYGAKYYDGTTTYGGYSDIMVADEQFVVSVPNNLPLDGGAPLLCAGITVYSPCLHVGVVGLGGLGHVAVKFAKAMGVKVTVISTSPNKKKEATEHLGAYSFVAAMGTLDGIIDTVSASHPLLPLIGLLKRRKIVAGSCTGGMKETQEMINFAAKHNIITDIEVIPIDYVNIAMERLSRADVKY
ncbi:hypothetical protein Q3G72_005782 [Acer saccharum]|nr:hypothetical protein Q3G72_005782 [Acer saccharum]